MLIPKAIYAMDDVISQGDSFINAGKGQEKIDTDALKTTSDDIYNILFTIAIVLAVAVGMVIGIQFMIGGAAEQAKVKETLIPYVIGVFVVFASFTIWKIAVNIGNSILDEEQVITEKEASKFNESVLAVTEDQINKMNKEELIDYYEDVLVAIKNAEAFAYDSKTGITYETEEQQKLKTRKELVEKKINNYRKIRNLDRI